MCTYLLTATLINITIFVIILLTVVKADNSLPRHRDFCPVLKVYRKVKTLFSKKQPPPQVDTQPPPQVDTSTTLHLNTQIISQADTMIPPQEGTMLFPVVDIPLAPQVDAQQAPQVDAQQAPRVDTQQAPQVGIPLTLQVDTTSHDVMTLASGSSSAPFDFNPGGKYSLSFKSDGNLIISDPQNVKIWESGTSGNTGAVLTMLPDGVLSIVDIDGNSKYVSNMLVSEGARAIFNSVDGTLGVYKPDNTLSHSIYPNYSG